MTPSARLRLVDREPVSIPEQWREEVKARDWNKVHIEGDRNPPILLRLVRWKWSCPIDRKGK